MTRPSPVHIVLVSSLLAALSPSSVHTIDDSFAAAPSIRLKLVRGGASSGGLDLSGRSLQELDDNSIETGDADSHGKMAARKNEQTLLDKYKPELAKLAELRLHSVKEVEEEHSPPLLTLTQVDRNPDAELLAPSSLGGGGAPHPKLVVSDLMIPRPVKSADTVLDPAVRLSDATGASRKPTNLIEDDRVSSGVIDPSMIADAGVLKDSGGKTISLSGNGISDGSSAQGDLSSSKDVRPSSGKDRSASAVKDTGLSSGGNNVGSGVSYRKDNDVTSNKDTSRQSIGSQNAVTSMKDAVTSAKDAVSSRKDAVDPCLVCDCKEATSLLSCNRKALQHNYTSLLSSPLLSYKYTTVCLSNNDIEKVTQFPRLEQITRLCLSNNPLKVIEDGVFKLLTNLLTLDLSHTKLNSFVLTPNVFQGNYAPDSYEPLKSLKILNLSYNDFHSLNADLFEHLPSLEELHVGNNPLGVIDMPTSIALSSIPYLKILDLSGTGLTALPNHLLHTPRYLHTLDLSFNQFHSVPEQLAQSHDLQVLNLNGNPIPVIKSFPALPKLHTLSLSYMPELVSLQANSLSNLGALQSFSAANNSRLSLIHSAAFSRTQVSEDGQTWTTVWPPLEKLVLSNNALQRLEGTLVARWDKLKVLDIRHNPWMCDCDNQWLVSSLLPLLEANHPQYINNLKCRDPVEMANLNLLDLDHKGYRLRCLDLYNHRPETDSLLLILVLLFSLLALPLLINLILCARRRASAPPICPNVHYSRAFYKSGVRTPSTSDVISTHYIL